MELLVFHTEAFKALVAYKLLEHLHVRGGTQGYMT